MEDFVRAMMKLLANEVCGEPLNPSEYHFEDDDLINLYSFSCKHDIAHLVGDALIKNGLLHEGDIKAKFEKQIMTAVYRYEKINYELNCLCKVMSDAEIPHIPLKGAVIRRYYPKPWMRNSCDIDILVKEEDLSRAVGVLVEKPAYKAEAKGSHDISFTSQSGVHLELHFTLIENDISDKANKVLEDIWEAVIPAEEYPYCFSLTDEMFYYYNIVHTAKHFQIGGCGIRPFLDLWILNHKIGFDAKKRRSLLEEGGMLAFAEYACQLSEVWFGNAEHSPLTKQMEKYILDGGVYGNMANRITVKQSKKGGKIKYMLSRIWLPYEQLKNKYPSLEKHRFLMPLYEVRRWFGLFCGGGKRSVIELNTVSSISKQQVAEMNVMMKELGL